MEGVKILGAGLAGLGCAQMLPGCCIFEAKSHLGGRVHSHQLGPAFFDQGAHICHTKSPELLSLFREAAGEVHSVSRSVVRNFWNRRWTTYPVQNHLHELPPKIRTEALMDFVAAQMQRDGNEPADYGQWCVQQYGEYLSQHFYDVYTRKYWRVPMNELATDWLSGRLIPSQVQRIIGGAISPQVENQATFATFHYPETGGYFQFFKSLYENVAVHLNERAAHVDPINQKIVFESGRVEHYEQLVSTIPLPDLVQIIKDAPTRVVEASRALRCTQLLCINMVIARPLPVDCHWFYIYDEDVAPSRVSLPSRLAPRMCPADVSAVQAEVFRRDDEPMSIDELVEKSVRDLSSLMGFDQNDVTHVDHRHVRRAYVISTHQRAAAVSEILEWLETLNIHSIGLYGRWKYIWSDQAFGQGRQKGKEIRDKYDRLTDTGSNPDSASVQRGAPSRKCA